MCKIDKCETHVFDYGYCLKHYKESLGIEDRTTKKRKSRKKKVDAVEVLTTDATEPVEEREVEVTE